MWLMILLQPGGIQLPGSAKVHFSRDHRGNTLSWKQFWAVSHFLLLAHTSLFQHLLHCAEILSLRAWFLLQVDGVFSLIPFQVLWLNLPSKQDSEAWPRALWNQPFYLLIGLYTELTVYSSQLQKQYGPFPNLPCPKPGTEQIVIISFILLPVFFFSSAWVSAVWCFYHGMYVLE